MIQVTIDKEVTFDLEPGFHKAKITNVKVYHKQTSNGKQDWIRPIWGVQCKGKENMDCRAGRNFLLSLKPGSDLRNFLTPILGPEFFKENSATTLDLEKVLVGLSGVISLSHFCGANNDKPFVVVDAFEPMEAKD